MKASHPVIATLSLLPVVFAGAASAAEPGLDIVIEDEVLIDGGLSIEDSMADPVIEVTEEITIEDDPPLVDEIAIEDPAPTIDIEAADPVIESPEAIVIEGDIDTQTQDLTIDDGSDIQIDATDVGAADPESAIATQPDRTPMAPAAESDNFSLRVDDVWLEYGRFTNSGSETDNAFYGKASVVANWTPAPGWEVRAAGRIDGYSEDDQDSFTRIRADYGDSYVSYRSGGTRLTAGAQTVIWGRLDEIPLSDRVSTADLSRFVLDDLADRRRANPMLRAETAIGPGTLDLVWLVDFREAELPDQGSVWYPINTRSGRIIGIDPDDIPPAAVKGATVVEDAPGGDGGFGARYTAEQSFADIGVTLARTRQSIPYFRAAGPGRFEAEYPRSWAVGADAAIDAMGATWRIEIVHSSDNPVTRSDLSYTTTPAISWGGGAEFFPGDGDTRINLQLVGMNMYDAPSVLDRSEAYALNGQIEAPFDRDRWRLTFDFNFGLDADDVYLNPKLSFLGWEPHEVYAAIHYFDGDDNTFGGFHEDHSLLNLGWRAEF
jgi:hypothetical protein